MVNLQSIAQQDEIKESCNCLSLIKPQCLILRSEGSLNVGC